MVLKAHDQLIQKVNARKGAGLQFGQGIWTADKYVASLQECVGPGICRTNFGNAQKSFSLVMKEAANKLTYAGENLVLEADCMGNVKLATSTDAIKRVLDGLEMPKHAMLAFTHVLTTPREDRDGDVLETAGAVVDTKMPLLWQHVHTLPIGKLLKVVEQSDEKLRMASVLLDINQLTSDACKLFEAGALRFSHGFRALEFNERNKEVAGAPGFRVKRFEIMEESGVSVPSNIDAEVELLSRGKLKSAPFKAHAEAMRRLLPKKFPGMTLKMSSLQDLKAAADQGIVKTIAEQGVTTLEIGKQPAGKPSDQPAGKTGDCGCGGKCGHCGDAAGSKDKAPMPRESYNTREEAEARATVLGCTGSWAEILPSGKIVWHPCEDSYASELYAVPLSAPAINKPTGSAGAKPAAKSADKDGHPIIKIYVNSASLAGSYYNRISKLSEDANRFLMGAGVELDRDDYATVWALFDGYGIIQVCSHDEMGMDAEMEFYRADWSESDGQPQWSGLPQEVEISSNINITETAKSVVDSALKTLATVAGTRAGRTLSQANVQRLEIIKQDLAELASLDVSRAAAALCERAQRVIEELISSATPAEDNQPKSLTFTDAALAVLECKSLAQLQGFHKALNAVILSAKNDQKAADYRKVFGRK